jgi:hypothetical protein
MTDPAPLTLLDRLLAVITIAELHAQQGPRQVAWVTYRRPDNTRAQSAATRIDGAWICDGRAVDATVVRVLHDRDVVLRRCAADRDLIADYRAADEAYRREPDPFRSGTVCALWLAITRTAERYNLTDSED